MNSRKALTLPACSSFLHVILSGLLRTSLDSSETFFETLSEGERAVSDSQVPVICIFFFTLPQPPSALDIKKHSSEYRLRSGRWICPTRKSAAQRLFEAIFCEPR